jgi:hypothetical protein
MATTGGKQTPASKSKAKDDTRAEAALERLNASLDAAQDAAKALRTDMGRGTRDLARNLERLIKANRRDAAKLAKAVRRDLAELQKAVTSSPARPRAKAGTTGARSTTPRARKTTTRKAPARKR